MRRRVLSNLLTVASFVLFLAAAAAGVADLLRPPLRYARGDASAGEWFVGATEGEVRLGWRRLWADAPDPRRRRPLTDASAWGVPGFRVERVTYLGAGHDDLPPVPYGRQQSLRLSLPLLIGVTAALPVAWLLTAKDARRAARRRRGLCPLCTYDVRATPGRCPECGWEDPAGIIGGLPRR